MRFETRTINDVQPDGTVTDGGVVEVNGVVRMGRGGSCRLPGCNCSPGYWVSIVHPRDAHGVVRVAKVVFDSATELDTFLATGEAKP